MPTAISTIFGFLHMAAFLPVVLFGALLRGKYERRLPSNQLREPAKSVPQKY